jgi:hypothetical protein
MLTRNVQPLPEVTQGAHRWWALAAVECGSFVVSPPWEGERDNEPVRVIIRRAAAAGVYRRSA